VGATLERLESLNVPVVGFGTRRFPGFYLADSGFGLDWSVENAEEAAAVIAALLALRDSGVAALGGLVIANPIPPEEQLDPALHGRVLADGLAALERGGIQGKAVTPFLLDYFVKATGGESLRVNTTIIRNNARLAARIAVALAARA
jgi:pseudouridine-5'-phosphate glycosidase